MTEPDTQMVKGQEQEPEKYSIWVNALWIVLLPLSIVHQLIMWPLILVNQLTKLMLKLVMTREGWHFLFEADQEEEKEIREIIFVGNMPGRKTKKKTRKRKKAGRTS